MSDNTMSFGPDRVSYAYRLHGELPGNMGAFYRDADKSRAAFEKAHNAQIEANVPERFRGRAARSSGAFIPDAPHPDYATAHKRASDENWFQVLAPDLSDKALTRAEFKALRKKADLKAERQQPRWR